ncbi:ankyrin repeat protein [Schizosaccharomyces osmophilus]|uniref:Ankyrin repeat protein n=1 Tax=Schizosaccharomyces osmophilus TaxID=2545709 RepID=A0AAF0AYU4_9SCHI|nr:ankyrin repeat protein [Schizosaccharomyces osmophilus]WBW74853.1 ankyrin repeat protein [Schizosaccharomyces osmophilus]
MATISPNIWIAASDGNAEIVLKHLQNGVSPNQPDENGYTAMHAAASYGHRDLLEILVEHGGDANVNDQDGETPLFVCEKIEVAQDLIEKYKADACAKNNDGLIAAQVVEENGEFPELASYLYTFSDLEPNNGNMPKDTKLEYAQYLSPQEMDEAAGQPLLDQNRKAEIDRILALRESGVNIDDQLREVLQGAFSEHFERNVRSREQ